MEEKNVEEDLERIYKTAQELKKLAKEMEAKIIMYEAIFEKVGRILKEHRDTINIHSEGILETAERVDSIEKKLKPVENDMYG